VVAGRWYGVTGRRFVRPVLQAPGQRRLIALLDHKPWSAEEGVQWLAAFPDDGNVGPSRLQVAPDIAVELPAAGPDAGDGKPRPARLTRMPVRPSSLEAEAAPADTPTATPRQTNGERQEARRTAEIEAARDAALAEIEAIRQMTDEARADADRLRAELDQAHRESARVDNELDHTRTDADRLRTELSHVRAEANTLRLGHDETRAKAERLEADVVRLRTDATGPWPSATPRKRSSSGLVVRPPAMPTSPHGPWPSGNSSRFPAGESAPSSRSSWSPCSLSCCSVSRDNVAGSP
jgi:hypothetical protein